MQPARLDLRVIQGATLRKPLLLMQPHYVYLPITAIQQTAPLRLTVPAHGMPDGWPCWLEGTAGWAQLNRDKLREPFRIGAVVDANTIVPFFRLIGEYLRLQAAEASEDDSDATKALREALEARRKRAKPVMPDFLSDNGGMH